MHNLKMFLLDRIKL